MNCKDLIDSLDDYLEKNRETPEVLLEIEEHLKLCPPCMDYWRSYREIAHSNLDPEEIEVPEQVTDKIHKSINKLLSVA